MSLNEIGTHTSSWHPSDYAAVIAVTSIVVTIVIFLCSRSCTKQDSRRKEVLQHLKDLLQTATEATEAVVIHITWDTGRKPKAEIYILLRKVMTASETLESIVPSKKEDLFRHCYDWHTNMTAHFPVDAKANAFKKNGAEVRNLKEGMKSYSEFLNVLIASCVKGKLKV